MWGLKCSSSWLYLLEELGAQDKRRKSGDHQVTFGWSWFSTWFPWVSAETDSFTRIKPTIKKNKTDHKPAKTSWSLAAHSRLCCTFILRA